jgi:hypothetical protein
LINSWCNNFDTFSLTLTLSPLGEGTTIAALVILSSAFANSAVRFAVGLLRFFLSLAERVGRESERGLFELIYGCA